MRLARPFSRLRLLGLLLLPLLCSATSYGQDVLLTPDAIWAYLPPDLRLEAADSLGSNAYVAWSATIPSGDTAIGTIRAQRFVEGRPVGEILTVTDDGSRPTGTLKVLALTSYAIVLWTDVRAGRARLYARALSWSGSPIGSPRQIAPHPVEGSLMVLGGSRHRTIFWPTHLDSIAHFVAAQVDGRDFPSAPLVTFPGQFMQLRSWPFRPNFWAVRITNGPTLLVEEGRITGTNATLAGGAWLTESNVAYSLGQVSGQPALFRQQPAFTGVNEAIATFPRIDSAYHGYGFISARGDTLFVSYPLVQTTGYHGNPGAWRLVVYEMPYYSGEWLPTRALASQGGSNGSEVPPESGNWTTYTALRSNLEDGCGNTRRIVVEYELERGVRGYVSSREEAEWIFVMTEQGKLQLGGDFRLNCASPSLSWKVERDTGHWISRISVSTPDTVVVLSSPSASTPVNYPQSTPAIVLRDSVPLVLSVEPTRPRPYVISRWEGDTVLRVDSIDTPLMVNIPMANPWCTNIVGKGYARRQLWTATLTGDNQFSVVLDRQTRETYQVRCSWSTTTYTAVLKALQILLPTVNGWRKGVSLYIHSDNTGDDRRFEPTIVNVGGRSAGPIVLLPSPESEFGSTDWLLETTAPDTARQSIQVVQRSFGWPSFVTHLRDSTYLTVDSGRFVRRTLGRVIRGVPLSDSGLPERWLEVGKAHILRMVALDMDRRTVRLELFDTLPGLITTTIARFPVPFDSLFVCYGQRVNVLAIIYAGAGVRASCFRLPTLDTLATNRLLSATKERVSSPAAVFDDDSLLVVWQDSRRGTTDIFGARWQVPIEWYVPGLSVPDLRDPDIQTPRSLVVYRREGNLLFISPTSTGLDAPFHASLYTLNGAVVASDSPSGGKEITFDLGSLPTGVYVVEVLAGNERSSTLVPVNP